MISLDKVIGEGGKEGDKLLLYKIVRKEYVEKIFVRVIEVARFSKEIYKMGVVEIGLNVVLDENANQ